jgi:hypothetical protein
MGGQPLALLFDTNQLLETTPITDPFTNTESPQVALLAILNPLVSLVDITLGPTKSDRVTTTRVIKDLAKSFLWDPSKVMSQRER